MRYAFFRTVLTALLVLEIAAAARAGGAGMENTTIFIIRHAEKPDDGDGLTPVGVEHANAYAGYFTGATRPDPERGAPSILFAAEDSKNSSRPRLTLEPLAKALGLPIDTRYKDKHFQALADELRAHHAGKTILICWHHGEMPELLRALGADPAQLLPGGRWPGNEYRWVIELRYDAQGQMAAARRIDEHF